jgi:hypothetical protein
MATQKAIDGGLDARLSNEDLRGKELLCATLDTDSNYVLAGNGEYVVGVIQEGGNVGDSTTVMSHGVARVIAGGVVAVGAKVQSNASGQAVTGSTNSIGTALTGASAAGIVIEVDLDRT